MFHFPALPPHQLYIHQRVTRHHSCRVSPFGHPRIHARLAAPRGISQPPTSFIGSRCQGIHHAPLNTYKHKNQETKIAKQTRHTVSLVRCSQPLSTKQTPHPTTKMERQHTHPHQGSNKRACCLRTQQCAQTKPADTTPEEAAPVGDQSCCRSNYLHHRTTHYRRRRKISQPHHPHPCEERGNMVLLRKEVIQPHLPVRLPCYDFVPIADPTFDGSLHKG